MPEPDTHNSNSAQAVPPSANPDTATSPVKKRRSKNRKRRARTQSFLLEDDVSPGTQDGETAGDEHANLRDSFYRLGMASVSGESLDSEALLDHR
jgi:hypothetical protein